MARVAFVCAMPMELRALAKRLGLRSGSGRFAGHDVVAVVTGVGTQLATEGTERLLDTTDVDRVIVVGITGAVDNATPIGAVIRPEVVVDGATGSRHRPDPLGSGRGAPPQGVMWTTDTLTTAAELPRLRAEGVVALDMETAAIAACCERRGIPWSVIRAISDRASDGSVDEEIFGLSHQDGTPNGRAIVRYVVRHPLRIPRLIALGRGASLATKRAAAAAADALVSLR